MLVRTVVRYEETCILDLLEPIRTICAASCWKPTREGGRGTLQELAKPFGVSWEYSKKIRAQQLKTGQKERPRRAGMARPAA